MTYIEVKLYSIFSKTRYIAIEDSEYLELKAIFPEIRNEVFPILDADNLSKNITMKYNLLCRFQPKAIEWSYVPDNANDLEELNNSIFETLDKYIYSNISEIRFIFNYKFENYKSEPSDNEVRNAMKKLLSPPAKTQMLQYNEILSNLNNNIEIKTLLKQNLIKHLTAFAESEFKDYKLYELNTLEYSELENISENFSMEASTLKTDKNFYSGYSLSFINLKKAATTELESTGLLLRNYKGYKDICLFRKI